VEDPPRAQRVREPDHHELVRKSDPLFLHEEAVDELARLVFIELAPFVERHRSLRERGHAEDHDEDGRGSQCERGTLIPRGR